MLKKNINCAKKLKRSLFQREPLIITKKENGGLAKQ